MLSSNKSVKVLWIKKANIQIQKNTDRKDCRGIVSSWFEPLPPRFQSPNLWQFRSGQNHVRCSRQPRKKRETLNFDRESQSGL